MISEEKRLYPLRFLPVNDSYAWGEDVFMLADLGYRDSVARDGWLAANSLSEIMDTYMDRVSGEHVFGMYGRQFPVQIKTIRCKGIMPLRVHPDDGTAAQRYDALGREKLWYVSRASKDAVLYIGWRERMDATTMIESVREGSIEKYLNPVKVKAGDFLHIRPGVVHCAKGDVEITEVSQASALDFCLYAWGGSLGPEEFDESMNIVEALDFIDYNPYTPESAPETASPAPGVRVLADLPQFTVRKIDLKTPFHIKGGDDNSFSAYFCLYGSAAVEAEIDGIGNSEYDIQAGQALLVPAEVDDFILKPAVQNSAVLEVMIERKAEEKAGNEDESGL